MQGEGKMWFVASALHIPTSHRSLDLTLHLSLQTW